VQKGMRILVVVGKCICLLGRSFYKRLEKDHSVQWLGGEFNMCRTRISE